MLPLLLLVASWFFFKENNEKKVHDAMVKSIKKGIECNLLSVISITFILENDKKYSVRIIRDKWKDLLNEALQKCLLSRI